MKIPKVAVIIAIVIAGGIALAFITNYIARESSRNTIVSPPVKKEIPIEKIEPEYRPVQAAAPVKADVVTPVKEAVSDAGPEPEVLSETEMPPEQSEGTVMENAGEAPAPEEPEPRPAEEPPADTPAPVSVPAEQEGAPVATGALPVFMPVTSATGPVPSTSSQPSSSITAVPVAGPQNAEGIASFVPKQSPTGPASSAPTQQLPSFTPVTNTTGPVASKNR